MGVGIYLNGRTSGPDANDPDSWLDGVLEPWLGTMQGDDFWGNEFLFQYRRDETYDGRPAYFLALHPAGEEVEFIVPAPGRVLVSAKTSTVGPGYHTCLCNLVKRFGEDCGIAWNPKSEADDGCHDETGYFWTGDRQAVEDEMLLHLKRIAEISLEQLNLGHGLIALHMPIGHTFLDGVAGEQGVLCTPMGLRTAEWVKAVAAEPRAGRNIYPWWDEGTAAGFYLGRAVSQMWSVVRWRPVLLDEEYDDWDGINRDLCKAYERDATLDYPWREWAELIDILEKSEGASDCTEELIAEVKARAAIVPEAAPRIGYRRHPVRVHLAGGWSIRIPGAMAEEWKESTWSAWDGDRTIWVTPYRFEKDEAPVPAAQALAGMKIGADTPLTHRDRDVVGHAGWGELVENGERLRNLKAVSAVDGKTALVNIYFHDTSDDEWALATWKSLTNSHTKKS